MQALKLLVKGEVKHTGVASQACLELFVQNIKCSPHNVQAAVGSRTRCPDSYSLSIQESGCGTQQVIILFIQAANEEFGCGFQAHVGQGSRCFWPCLCHSCEGPCAMERWSQHFLNRCCYIFHQPLVDRPLLAEEFSKGGFHCPWCCSKPGFLAQLEERVQGVHAH